MARRRRSLLGGSKRPPSLAPAPKREAAPPPADDGPPPDSDVPTLDDAPTVSPDEQALEDAETELIQTDARPKVPPADDEVSFELEEDEDPLIGGDLSIPPADDLEDDTVEAPEEVQASLDTAPPTDEPPAELEAMTDDNLVMFDERPDDAPAVDDVDVEEDTMHDEPDGDAGADTSAAAEGAAASDADVTPAATDQPDDAVPPPPGFDAADAPQLRGGTPEPAPPRPRPAPGFEEETSDPPTEDQPSHLPEDLASLYQAPMNVPEPPPIPGILDRFTPAPARHTEGRPSSAGPSEERAGFVPTQPASSQPPPAISSPSGMWDETPIAKDTPPPVPVVRQSPQAQEEPPIWKDPWFITVVGIAALAAVIVVVAGLLWASSNPGAQDSVVQPRTVTPTMPSNIRTPDEAPPADDAGEGSDPDVVQPIAVEPEVKPRPRVRQPKPDTTSEPVARTGRLKIRSARQVLVSVNGQPVGMTPLDLDKPAGKYVVTASVDGRKVEERVDLKVGTIRLIEL